jgi:hypothetical protein
MADKIQLRAGNKASMPTLTDREPAYVRDEEAVYIGTPNGNKKLCSAATEGRVTALEQTVATHGTTLSAHESTINYHGSAISAQQTILNGKLTAFAVPAQAGVAADADAATIAAALNALIAAMKSSGIMNT